VITSRLLTGIAAVVLPRSLGESLGLFHIGGGQGMFWFTEIDTILFDFIILCAVFAVASHGLLSWRNPLLWLLGLITVLAAVPLGYVITNYGTLFRLRAMVFVGLALIPLALATSVRRDAEPVADTSPAS
jgi:peptidoglycan/LPS O-acetylase OafA/YrhL